MEKSKLIFLLTLLLLIGGVSKSPAQSWDEWFHQSDTQKRYLINQIAALQVYIGYVEKGYKVARDGLKGISNIKNLHLSLDKNFFDSKEIVSNSVKSYWKVNSYDTLINRVRSCTKALNDLSYGDCFSVKELNYIKTVFNGLMSDSEVGKRELDVMVTDHSLELSDDERIKRIDALYDVMLDRSLFAIHLRDGFKILAIQRKKDAEEIRLLKKINGIQ